MIYYVGSYRTKNITERNPQGSLAEDVMIGYFISIIKLLQNVVTVVSILASLNGGFHRRKECVIDERETQVYLESYDTTKKGFSKIGALQRLISLFFYLVMHACKDDIVLVYNTQLFSVPVRLAKWIKRFKMVLEVEEIFYMDNRNPVDVKRRPLEDALIKASDAYIVASKLLAMRIAGDKPCAIVYGGYTIPPRYTMQRSDGKIHVVYAGGIDSLRRVDRAVRAFSILPDNYRFHILGTGAQADIQSLQRHIDDVNRQAGYIKVEYLGCLYGQEYDTYLQSCHIGLNLQVRGAAIEEVAFPSKISSYLARGLSVISGKLTSIVHSPLARGIHFYSDDTKEKIAEAILSCKIEAYDDQTALIAEAEQQFLEEFKSIIC